MADPLTVYTLCGLACILQFFSPNKQVSFLEKNSRALLLDPPLRLCHVGVGLVFIVFINCITLRILLWHDFAYVRATNTIWFARFDGLLIFWFLVNLLSGGVFCTFSKTGNVIIMKYHREVFH